MKFGASFTDVPAIHEIQFFAGQVSVHERRLSRTGMKIPRICYGPQYLRCIRCTASR